LKTSKLLETRTRMPLSGPLKGIQWFRSTFRHTMGFLSLLRSKRPPIGTLRNRLGALTLWISQYASPISTSAATKMIPIVKISCGYALDSTLSLGVTGGSGRCRRLSANHCFVGEPIFSRRRLLRLFIRVAMAGRFLLSQLHERSSLEIIAGALALFWMSQASFRSGWNGFPRHTSAN
jgi:hypothetical protein